jgi:hypothetical protein
LQHPVDGICGLNGKSTESFLLKAHHADLGNGESVNCNGGKEEDNDIHIAFGDAADTQECSSFTAEISPH